MFAYNLTLCKFILRRDRVSILIWLIILLALTVGYGNALPGMYPSEVDRLVMRDTLQSPAMVAMLGPVYDEGGYTIGAMYTSLMLLWSAMIMAAMNIFLAVRHTRKDEELGRHEVIRSLPVGRLSILSSTLSVALFVNVLFAVFIGFGLAFLGDSSMGFEGSILFGAACGAIGMLFASATAIICQLCDNPRSILGYAFGIFGISFMIRAIGDIQQIEFLACVSPLGLILRTKPYTSDVWWPLQVTIGTASALALMAFRLCSVRDLGAGIIPPRLGKRDASQLLSSPYGLAWSLLRTPFIIWTAVIFMLGASYGSIMGDLEAFIETNVMFSQILSTIGGQSLIEQFISFLMAIMAIITTVPVLIFMLTILTQEKRGYTENLFARSISRFSQLSAYVIISAAASIVMPIVTALGFWIASSAVMAAPVSLITFMRSAMLYIPAIWSMIGIAVLLAAYIPRLTSLVWTLLGYSFFIAYVGSVLKLPSWANYFNPFHYVPTLVMTDPSYIGIIMLTVISVALVATGFLGYRNRDMQLS